MRILFVVPYVPNLIRVRPLNFIRNLSKQGHQVTVLTLTNGSSEELDAAKLEQFSYQVLGRSISRYRSMWNCLLALPTNEPLQAAYSWQPELARDLTLLTHSENGNAPFDIVHVEHLRGARYGLHLKQAIQSGAHHIPIVWDSVDCISELFRKAMTQSRSTFGRWATRFELKRTERYESALLGQFSRILVTSAVDKDALSGLASNGQQQAEITILTNGVDLDYFKPDLTVERDPATIVISGKMSYHANVTMAFRLVEDIMPLVWNKRPEVKVLIVGKDPPKEILDLDNHPSIEVTGTVPDIRPYLQRATLAVVPITYGAGIQNKVLEAMACSTPVIADEIVSSSIKAKKGLEILTAADNEAYAVQILGILANDVRRRELGENGREYVSAHHNWPAITRGLEEVYKSAIDLQGE